MRVGEPQEVLARIVRQASADLVLCHAEVTVEEAAAQEKVEAAVKVLPPPPPPPPPPPRPPLLSALLLLTAQSPLTRTAFNREGRETWGLDLNLIPVMPY